jgi:transcriptional regulator with XRE-family HTH domain
MDEHLNNLDLVEMGRRFAAISKHLGLSQTEVADEIGTFQITISKIESGNNIMSPVYLKMLVFYSQTVSMDKLFEKEFDINDPDIFNKKYAVGTVIKARLAAIRKEMEDKEERISQLLKDTEELL